MTNNGSCGRPWTPQEDDLLRAAVAIYGDNTEKWKTIALSVPGRTNKACRKRWLHSLSPSVKKTAWTVEEDQLLMSLFEKHPNKWSRIARSIPGRTDDACSKRYREALDPNLKKDEWTEGEDRYLLDALTRFGGPTNPKWVLIGQELRRSSLGCRNRWRLLERKRKAALHQSSKIHAQVDSQNLFTQGSADNWPLFAEGGSSADWEAAFNALGITLENFTGSEANDVFRLAGPSGERAYTLRQDPASTVPGSAESCVTVRQEEGIIRANDPGDFSIIPSVTTPVSPTCEARRGWEHLQPPALSTSDNESSSQSIEAPIFHPVDHEASLDDDMFCPYDVGVQDSCRTDDAPHETPEDPCHTLDSPGETQTANRPVAHGTEKFGSLGTLAQAASTLSPSPLAASGPEQERQIEPIIIIPPRKRRRTAAGSHAFSGVHVIADISGKPRAEPKLSSSLPVAGDPSVLGYVCGHSACFSSDTSSSAACYSTSGELLNHYKDRHMDDAGPSDETPFRCGLKGCNKGWKSINGLQYHLQISKVHYQHIYSQTTAAKKHQIAARDLMTDNTSESNSFEHSSRHNGRRSHQCPHPGCLKEYKQLSGLRYHLLHGHPKDIPTQLTVIPPRIAKQLNTTYQRDSFRSDIAPASAST